MRAFVIPCWFTLAAYVALPAAADVIYLKNGDAIYADRVERTANSLRYEVGDSSFAIPLNKIERIEAAPSISRPADSVSMPAFAPETQVGDEPNLLEHILHSGEVDRGALASIESHGNAETSAIAYYIAGKSEFQAGRYPDARHDFETALRYQRDNPTILTYYASLLIRMGDSLDAISNAERATRIVPDSPDAFGVLGYAQYSARRLQDAISSWKRSLALRPDRTIQQLLARAQRESTTESNYSERETGHFVLRFEGSQSSAAFREQLLASLESQYQDLARVFGGEPRHNIQVVLYTQQAFFDVTRAPAWTGALNDGNLRIPLQGMDSVTAELARVLRHELTHSFVNQLTSGRCPQWLNEGVAQMLEPRSLAGRTAALAQLFKAEREIPLNMLERGFTALSMPEAVLAYDESLGMTEYIYQRYGMSDLLRVLQQIGQGEQPEAAIRSILHADYGSLEREYAEYLARQSTN